MYVCNGIVNDILCLCFIFRVQMLAKRNVFCTFSETEKSLLYLEESRLKSKIS